MRSRLRTRSVSSRFLAAPLIAVLLLPLLAGTAHSQSLWNAATGDWFTGTNWTPNGVPTATKDFQIDNGGTVQIAAPGAAVSQSGFLGNGTGNSGTLTVSGGSVSNDNGILGHNAGGLRSCARAPGRAFRYPLAESAFRMPFRAMGNLCQPTRSAIPTKSNPMKNLATEVGRNRRTVRFRGCRFLVRI